MTLPDSPKCVIIGAGFSGTLAAIHLLRASSAAHVTLLERSGCFGPGLAFSTASPSHLLNVPAGNMSAFEHEPDHFLKWARRRDASLQSGAFLPRRWYGEYLQHLLDEVGALPSSTPRLRRVAGHALSIEPAEDGAVVTVHTPRGPQAIRAHRVILAIGNAPPAHPIVDEPSPALSEVLRSPAYIHNPWKGGIGADGGGWGGSEGASAIDGIQPDEPLLILGTGLTMMDVVVSLAARDHGGRILALSRRGLIPRPHRSPARPPVHRDPPPALRGAGDAKWDGTIRSLVRAMRESVRQSARRGTDWRDVVSSIRSITPDLWARLDDGQRRRFLSRVRPYWEIVRHRAAPETAAAVADLIASRRLSVRAGRLTRLALLPTAPATSPVVEATFRPRGSTNPQTIRVSRIINCMGPDSDVRRSDDPLVGHLLRSGQITADAHGLGLRTTGEGWSIGSDGRPSGHLLVAGPLRRATLWENTAVPELRREADAIARAALAGPVRPAVVVRSPSALPAIG